MSDMTDVFLHTVLDKYKTLCYFFLLYHQWGTCQPIPSNWTKHNYYSQSQVHNKWTEHILLSQYRSVCCAHYGQGKYGKYDNLQIACATVTLHSVKRRLCLSVCLSVCLPACLPAPASTGVFMWRYFVHLFLSHLAVHIPPTRLQEMVGCPLMIGQQWRLCWHYSGWYLCISHKAVERKFFFTNTNINTVQSSDY